MITLQTQMRRVLERAAAAPLIQGQAHINTVRLLVSKGWLRTVNSWPLSYVITDEGCRALEEGYGRDTD